MLELVFWLYSYMTPAPPPCVAEVRWPELTLESPSWAFVVRPVKPCEDLRPSAAWMYSMGVDPAEPAEAEEYDGDIYQEETWSQ